MIPYYFYGCLLMFARWSISGFEIANFKWQLVDLGYLWGIGATWFLPCLFFAQLFYYIIKKLSFAKELCNKKILYIIMVLLAFGVMLLPFEMKINNVFVIVLFRSFIATAFIVVGDLLRKAIKKYRI